MPEIQLLIIDFIPPTLNDQINDARTSKFKSSKTKKHYTEMVKLKSISQKIEKFEGEGLIYQDITFFVSNFGRDWDNLVASIKFINDGLVLAGIMPNDNLNTLRPSGIHFEKCEKVDERIEIEMWEGLR